MPSHADSAHHPSPRTLGDRDASGVHSDAIRQRMSSGNGAPLVRPGHLGHALYAAVSSRAPTTNATAALDAGIVEAHIASIGTAKSAERHTARTTAHSAHAPVSAAASSSTVAAHAAPYPSPDGGGKNLGSERPRRSTAMSVEPTSRQGTTAFLPRGASTAPGSAWSRHTAQRRPGEKRSDGPRTDAGLASAELSSRTSTANRSLSGTATSVNCADNQLCAASARHIHLPQSLTTSSRLRGAAHTSRPTYRQRTSSATARKRTACTATGNN